ncbi:hypothetical protein HDU91_005178 [Kappamyces sp. JEL0680]|nr:hypothetical protein HDU91_005178 [Kappamyces sp. JEL0680]
MRRYKVNFRLLYILSFLLMLLYIDTIKDALTAPPEHDEDALVDLFDESLVDLQSSVKPWSPVVSPTLFNRKPKRSLTVKLLNQDPVFYFILQDVYDGLQQVGIRAEVVESVDLADTTSIYVTFITWKLELKAPQKYIVFNWEQLRPDANYWDTDFENYLKGAEEVWDYSSRNIEFLQSVGIRARFLLPGYNAFMADSILKTPNSRRTNDIIFFGAVKPYFNPRRVEVMSKLQIRFPDIQINPDRAAMTTAKVGLNIHSWGENTILETHRIWQMVSNKILCLSERSDDRVLDALFSPMVTWFDDDDFEEKVNQVLALSEEDYAKESMRRLKYLQSLPNFGDRFYYEYDSVLWN